jgi:hypothetical protein
MSQNVPDSRKNGTISSLQSDFPAIIHFEAITYENGIFVAHFAFPDIRDIPIPNQTPSASRIAAGGGHCFRVYLPHHTIPIRR